jgi:hypothetical protein
MLGSGYTSLCPNVLLLERWEYRTKVAGRVTARITLSSAFSIPRSYPNYAPGALSEDVFSHAANNYCKGGDLAHF